MMTKSSQVPIRDIARNHELIDMLEEASKAEVDTLSAEGAPYHGSQQIIRLAGGLIAMSTIVGMAIRQKAEGREKDMAGLLWQICQGFMGSQLGLSKAERTQLLLQEPE